MASGSDCQAIVPAACRAVAPVRRLRSQEPTVRPGEPLVARRHRVDRPPQPIPVRRPHRQQPAIQTTAKASVAGSGTVPHGCSTLPAVPSFVRAMPHRRFPAIKTDKFNWSAALSPKAAARSSRMNGTFRSWGWDCVRQRFMKRCRCQRSAPAAGNGRTSLSVATSLN